MASTPSEDSGSPLPSPSSVASPPESPEVDRPPMSPHSFSTPAAPTAANMTSSSTPLGNVNAARRPAPTVSTLGRGGAVNPDIIARMKAFHLNRQGAPAPGRGPVTPGATTPGAGGPSPTGPQMPGGLPANFRLPPGVPGGRPGPPSFASSPNVSGRGPSLAEKRGMKMPGGLPGAAPPAGAPAAGGRQKPRMTLSGMGGGANGDSAPPKQESAMDRYAEYIDKETGSLKFKGKAILNSKGVQFSSGQSFQISLDEVDTIDELGKGNYGTVYKVRHSRPQMRKVGQGLAGNKIGPGETRDETAAPRGNTTGIVMAMKEMRLELEDSKFATIIMELDVLHRCASPFIVDFYGAFFQEGAVYICMEFMDGGSMDKLYGDGVPENVLRKVTLATTRGLKSLKDEHNIIHRDVKPTNILINTAGAIKICDFGVSGNLVASIAKTNIGCQSYMAPERISSGGVAQAGANPGGGTYSVQSDIWSLGLTIIECAMGRYPYPPETYDNIFSQLSAIVDGEPPDLPTGEFSDAARNFVAGCLNKIPKLRPTYAMLLQHAWLAPLMKPDIISEEDEEAAEAADADPAQGEGIAAPESDVDAASKAQQYGDSEKWVDREVGEWVRGQIEKKRNGTLGKKAKPALHAAPLDATSSTKSNKGAVAV
ncbi:kinase-like protein [Aureobasidium pullulans]|uniref:mitogen-activated protein kinase kinase n=1 Tax=Aureobasidium pullulans TaxID=5580 RepID=A0A4S9AR65_AURPU|nr:kinase-like protein [Aureobasidium pullulans]THX80987.1 kinase-like protein [Aureobasidium pullulans]TIA72312.1 kinase-like protein [Aureobasidium pullulans]